MLPLSFFYLRQCLSLWSACPSGARGHGDLRPGCVRVVQDCANLGQTTIRTLPIPSQKDLVATVMLLKAVITAFPSVSLPFLAVPLP
eukprot:SAG22_NODE_6046_length_910_cov_1.172626_2_plen_86_part_01